MVATYDRHGIQFQYPENWQIQEEAPDAAVRCITLQSPGSAFWMLQALPAGESHERLATQVVESVRQEYQDVEVEDRADEIGGIQMVGYNLQFYCLDFVVSAQVRSFSLGQHTCVLLTQAEDSEFEKMEPVFRAIATSMIQQAANASGD